MVQLSHPYMTTGKTISLTRQTFVGKEMSLFLICCLGLSWASLIAQLVKKICLQCRRPGFNSWVRKICWRRDRLSTPLFLGFSCGSAGKESACNAGDLGLIPGLGRFPGEGKGYPLQYSGLQNSMNYTGTCSHEIKRFLLLGRKAMINLQFSSVQLLSHVRLFATP